MVTTAAAILSFEDYLTYDDGTENHYELVDGSLLLMNPPTIEHFLIVDFLYLAFNAEIQRLGLPWLTLREVGVRTGLNKSRLVDLCIVTKDQAKELSGQSAVFQTPPVLVIEVVSPESVTRDYRFKRSEYATAEIAEYWIVDPLEQKVTLLRWEEGFYESTIFSGEQTINSHTFPQVQLIAGAILAAGVVA
jgi:Uma2 family endonuclease